MQSVNKLFLSYFKFPMLLMLNAYLNILFASKETCMSSALTCIDNMHKINKVKTICYQIEYFRQ